MTRSKKDIKDCVFCGNCKANCPTFKATYQESMSARGRVALMGQLEDNSINLTSNLNKKVFSCILCGACNNSCPLNIEITQAIYDTRVKLKDCKKNTKFLSYAVSHFFKNIESYSLALRLINYAKQLNINKFKKLEGIFNLTYDISPQPLNKTLSLSKTLEPIGRIALFPGCTTNYVITKLGLDMIDLLNTLNYDVVIPRGIVCCGAPLISIGLQDKAKVFAEKNVKIFTKLSVDKIISLCPTCVYTIRDSYKKLIGSHIDNLIDTTTFVIENWQKIKTVVKGLDDSFVNSKLIYHHPCHTKNYLKIKSNDIIKILNELGLSVVLDEYCCGFGGLFKVLEGELSSSILNNKKEEYANFDSVITSCPNCIIQFKTGNIKSHHFIEIIKNSIRG